MSDVESAAAWEVYTLYHGLWFTRIVYGDGSLKQLVRNRDYNAANELLSQMLADMTEKDDGRFGGI